MSADAKTDRVPEEVGMTELDPAIRDYYDRRPEESRLEHGLGRLEAVRTRALIMRNIPAPPGIVLDVGGAGGSYAGWLAELGYTVHLIDPVPRLVAVAREYSRTLRNPITSLEVADARALPCPSSSADVVLLLGPLYHLLEVDDRLRALGEAGRVLKPGGVLVAAAISRWGSALDGIAYDFLAHPGFRTAVPQEVLDGRHFNPERRPGFFTTAYFHRPDELTAELARAGFEVRQLYGVEGPARMLSDFDARWGDPRRRADMIWMAELLECEPSLIGLSPHLLAIGVAC